MLHVSFQEILLRPYFGRITMCMVEWWRFSLQPFGELAAAGNTCTALHGACTKPPSTNICGSGAAPHMFTGSEGRNERRSDEVECLILSSLNQRTTVLQWEGKKRSKP